MGSRGARQEGRDRCGARACRRGQGAARKNAARGRWAHARPKSVTGTSRLGSGHDLIPCGGGSGQGRDNSGLVRTGRGGCKSSDASYGAVDVPRTGRARGVGRMRFPLGKRESGRGQDGRWRMGGGDGVGSGTSTIEERR